MHRFATWVVDSNEPPWDGSASGPAQASLSQRLTAILGSNTEIGTGTWAGSNHSGPHAAGVLPSHLAMAVSGAAVLDRDSAGYVGLGETQRSIEAQEIDADADADS